MSDLENDFTCEHFGCNRHPSKGDTIFRTSPKGEAFRGRCEEHIGDFDLTVKVITDAFATPKGENDE